MIVRLIRLVIYSVQLRYHKKKRLVMLHPEHLLWYHEIRRVPFEESLYLTVMVGCYA
jgi:hypothetical protein